MNAVAQVDPGAPSGAELVDAIVASEKALSLLAARQMGLLAEFARPGRAGDVRELVAELMDKGGDGRRPDGDIDLDTVEALVEERATSLAAAEVAAALQISPITAGSRVRKAQDLCTGLPATVNALAEGRIDRGRAWLIAERTTPLSPSLREAVEDRILPIAEDRSAGNLRGLLDRAVIAADPQAAENRERKAKRNRELVFRSLPDGMASVRANAPADAAVSIFTLADLLAGRTGTDDDRPVAARRVDAWHDIAEQLLTHGYVDLTDLLETTDSTNESVASQRLSDGVDGCGIERSAEPANTSNADAEQTAGTVDNGAATSTPATSDPNPGTATCDLDDAATASSPATSDPNPDTATCDLGNAATPTTPATSDPNPDTATCDLGSTPTPTNPVTSSPDADTPTCDHGATGADGSSEPPANCDSSTSAATRGDESASGQPVSESAAGRRNNESPASVGSDRSPASSVPTRTSKSDTTLQPTGAATSPGAQRSRCPSCGGQQADTLAGNTNRADRRILRRASRQGRRPHLTVTLSASTLAGLDRLPGHLEGYGAITAETALMIARSAATITTVLLDPATGSITGSGARTYRPSQATRDITTTLATTCRFPSCRQPAWRCDLDHRDRFDHTHPGDGGATDPVNLDPLCRAHHWLKHHAAWSSTRGPGHTQIWSSPTGHRYSDPPRTLTLPGELLAASALPSVDRPNVQDGVAHGRDQTDIGGTVGIDGEGLREDWRDAEFGGPFPDTIDLKVLVTTVRSRVQQVRDILTAPRPPRPQDRHRDDQPRQDDHDQGQHDQGQHEHVQHHRNEHHQDNHSDPVTDTPSQVRPVDPDEPPF